MGPPGAWVIDPAPSLETTDFYLPFSALGPSLAWTCAGPVYAATVPVVSCEHWSYCVFVITGEVRLWSLPSLTSTNFRKVTFLRNTEAQKGLGKVTPVDVQQHPLRLVSLFPHHIVFLSSIENKMKNCKWDPRGLILPWLLLLPSSFCRGAENCQETHTA